jgi:hypothetical protein
MPAYKRKSKTPSNGSVTVSLKPKSSSRTKSAKKSRTRKNGTGGLSTASGIVSRQFNCILRDVPYYNSALALTTPFIGTSRPEQFIVNIQNVVNSGWVTFNPELTLGLAAYANVFKEYRIDNVKIRFIPVCSAQTVEIAGSTATAFSNQSTPLFYCAKLVGTEQYGSSNPPDGGEFRWNSEDEAIISGAKPISMSRGMTMSFKPPAVEMSTVTAVLNSGSAAAGVSIPVAKRGNWYPFSLGQPASGAAQPVSGDPVFYGFKYLVSAASADTGDHAYRLLATFTYSLRGGRDDNLNQIQINQDGTTCNVHTPFHDAFGP